MLTLSLDRQLVDLPPDTDVALSYRVSDLATLGSREAGFSETFTLPLTHRNLRVLELAHSLDSNTSIPYRRLPFVLECNDVPVLTGQALVERSSGDGFEVTLLSTAGALFAAVGESKLRDLDLSQYDHLFTSTAVQSAQTVDSDTVYTYPLVNDGRFTRRYPVAGQAVVHYTELSPAVFSHALLRNIVSQALPGYTVGGTLLQDERFLRHQLFGGDTGPFRRESYLREHTTVARTSAPVTVSSAGVMAFQRLVFNAEVNDPGQHLRPATGGGTAYQTLPEVSGYQIQLEAEVTYEGIGGPYVGTQRAQIVVVENLLGFKEEVLYEGEWAPQFAPQTKRIKLDFTMNRVSGNGEIIFEVQAENRMRLTVAAGAKVTVTPLARAYDNSPVHLDAGLPDVNQSEILLLLANQFGAIYQTDEVTRTVRVDRLVDVTTNRAAKKVADWTSMIDFSQRPQLQYRLDNLARRNVFAYDEAPSGYELLDNAEYNAEGELLCPNDATLEAENEAYTVPMPALREDVAFNRLGVIPFVPRYTHTVGASFEIWRPGITYPTDYYVLDRGRYWQATQNTQGTSARPQASSDYWKLVYEESTIYSGGDAPYFCGLYEPLSGVPGVLVGGQGTTPWVPQASVGFDGLDFATDLLPAYYPALTEAFQRVVLLTLAVRITPVDIDALDFTVPVLLNVSHWPGYGPLQGLFLLQLIDQYQPGSTGPVRCELLCLNGPVVSQVLLQQPFGIFDPTFGPQFN